MGRNYLRYLRTGTVCMIYYKDESPQTTEIVEVVDTTPEEEVVMIEEIIENEELQPEEVIVVIEDPEKYYRPIAFKTNLLFDALTALNVELEVPVSKRVSITGEYTFPWWLMKSKQNCLEVIYGNVEDRYWIKPNYDKQKT